MTSEESLDRFKRVDHWTAELLDYDGKPRHVRKLLVYGWWHTFPYGHQPRCGKKDIIHHLWRVISNFMGSSKHTCPGVGEDRHCWFLKV